MTSQKVVSKGAPLFEPFFDQKVVKKGSKMTHFQGLEGPGQVWASPDQGWPRIVRFSRCFLSGSGALFHGPVQGPPRPLLGPSQAILGPPEPLLAIMASTGPEPLWTGHQISPFWTGPAHTGQYWPILAPGPSRAPTGQKGSGTPQKASRKP